MKTILLALMTLFVPSVVLGEWPTELTDKAACEQVTTELMRALASSDADGRAALELAIGRFWGGKPITPEQRRTAIAATTGFQSKMRTKFGDSPRVPPVYLGRVDTGESACTFVYSQPFPAVFCPWAFEFYNSSGKWRLVSFRSNTQAVEDVKRTGCPVVVDSSSDVDSQRPSVPLASQASTASLPKGEVAWPERLVDKSDVYTAGAKLVNELARGGELQTVVERVCVYQQSDHLSPKYLSALKTLWNAREQDDATSRPSAAGVAQYLGCIETVPSDLLLFYTLPGRPHAWIIAWNFAQSPNGWQLTGIGEFDVTTPSVRPFAQVVKAGSQEGPARNVAAHGSASGKHLERTDSPRTLPPDAAMDQAVPHFAERYPERLLDKAACQQLLEGVMTTAALSDTDAEKPWIAVAEKYTRLDHSLEFRRNYGRQLAKAIVDRTAVRGPFLTPSYEYLCRIDVGQWCCAFMYLEKHLYGVYPCAFEFRKVEDEWRLLACHIGDLGDLEKSDWFTAYPGAVSIALPTSEATSADKKAEPTSPEHPRIWPRQLNDKADLRRVTARLVHGIARKMPEDAVLGAITQYAIQETAIGSLTIPARQYRKVAKESQEAFGDVIGEYESLGEIEFGPSLCCLLYSVKRTYRSSPLAFLFYRPQDNWRLLEVYGDNQATPLLNHVSKVDRVSLLKETVHAATGGKPEAAQAK